MPVSYTDLKTIINKYIHKNGNELGTHKHKINFNKSVP